MNEALLRLASVAVRSVQWIVFSESGRLGAAEAVACEAWRERASWGASLVADACRTTGLDRHAVGLEHEADVRSAIEEILRDGATEDLKTWFAMTIVSTRYHQEPDAGERLGLEELRGVVAFAMRVPVVAAVSH